MAMIGYSQLMKDIHDVDKTSVELMLEHLSRHHVSALRMEVLKRLARKKEKETISSLLRDGHHYNTGGTFKAIASFFRALESDQILQSENAGRRTYWKFHKNAEHLEGYLRISA